MYMLDLNLKHTIDTEHMIIKKEIAGYKFYT